MVFSFIVGPCPGAAGAELADPSDAVQQALDDLDEWLGEGSDGLGWRAYLATVELRYQLALGRRADPAVVGRILDLYRAEVAALAEPQFASVRAALAAWLAELQPTEPAELVNEIEVAKSEFQAFGPDEIAAARDEVQRSIEQAEEVLARWGSEGPRWKRFLRWDELRSQSAATAEEADVEALETLRRRLASGHRGLERAPFHRLRNAMRKLQQRQRARGLNEQNYTAAMGFLRTNLEQYADTGNVENFDRVRDIVRILEERGQARPVLDRIRQRYSRPNLYVRVSEGLMQEAVRQEVSDESPVLQCILGTRITGTGDTRGTVQVDLVPSTNYVALDAIFAGTTRSRTVGRNGPATIYARGQSTINAKKRIFLNEYGITDQPTTSAINTRTRITGVATSIRGPLNRLVNRIARKRVAQSKRQAERIASRKAERQFNGRMDGQVAEMVGGGDDGTLDRIRSLLAERGQFPDDLRIRSTDTQARFEVLQADPLQLGAPEAPPRIDRDADVFVRIHESAINNLAFGFFSGVELTEADLLETVEELTGSVPERFQADPDQKPWTVTFPQFRPGPDFQPVTVRFRDGVVRMTFRGRAFKSGEDLYRIRMNITAKYRIENDGNRFRLVRQGGVEIFPAGFDPEKGRLSLRQSTLRSMLRRRFNKVFDTEFPLEDIALPEPLDHVRQLEVVHLAAEDGWLSVALSRIGLEPAALAAAPAEDAPLAASMPAAGAAPGGGE